VGRTEFTRIVAAGRITVTVRGVPKTAETLPSASFARVESVAANVCNREVVGAVPDQPAAIAVGGVAEVVIM